ncbi:MAG: hypothetical protein HY319_15015 [Armatimonadetes bacterium]|nr:hypothetical protein [Armatimonadota bacterium]
MARFMLTEPKTYFRHVVGSAVAGGASFVRMHTRPSEGGFEYDGRCLTVRLLEELFPSLFTTQEDLERAFLRELAVGLYGARGLGLKSVLLESWDGDQGARIRLTDTWLEIAPVYDQPSWVAGEPRNRILVQESSRVVKTARTAWSLITSAADLRTAGRRLVETATAPHLGEAGFPVSAGVSDLPARPS